MGVSVCWAKKCREIESAGETEYSNKQKNQHQLFAALTDNIHSVCVGFFIFIGNLSTEIALKLKKEKEKEREREKSNSNIHQSSLFCIEQF